MSEVGKNKNHKTFMFICTLNALPIKFYRLVRIYSFVCFHYICRILFAIIFMGNYSINALAE